MSDDVTSSKLGLGVRRDGWWWRLGLYVLANTVVGYVAIVVLAPAIFASSEVGSIDEAIGYAEDILDWLVSPLGLSSGKPDAGPLIVALVASCVVSAVQAIFLLPLFRPPTAGRRSRSIVASVIAAAFFGAIFVAAVVWAIIEVLSYTEEAVEAFSPAIFWLLPVAALVPSWLVWSWFLLRRVRRSTPFALDLMLGPLWMGSAASIIAIIPLDAITRRTKSCYCATGSFFALCVSVCGILFLLGPTVLLLTTRANRRRIRTRACHVCGYRRVRGSGPACPECGASWRRRGRPLRGAA